MIHEATDLIITAVRSGRPIVPFLGAGISLAAGFPNVNRLTVYLAKVKFALDQRLYCTRYPIVSQLTETAAERYARRPADFLADFGWPGFGQISADIAHYLRTPAGKLISRGKKIRSPFDAAQHVLLEFLREKEKGVVDALQISKPGKYWFAVTGLLCWTI